MPAVKDFAQWRSKFANNAGRESDSPVSQGDLIDLALTLASKNQVLSLRRVEAQSAQAYLLYYLMSLILFLENMVLHT